MNELLSRLLQDRVAALNQRPARDDQEFVLLWLQGQRRIKQNLAFAHAQRRANELGKPLVVYEGLRSDYPFASERFHRFVLEGRATTARGCEKAGVAYAFFLQTPGAPRGVLHRLASRAAVVITDWLPGFIHPAQTRGLAARAPCRVEAVDAAGVAPLARFPHAELGARTLRPKLMKLLPELLQPIPEVRPRLPSPRRFDWGFEPWTAPPDAGVRAAMVSREVPAAEGALGGRSEGLRRMKAFFRARLKGYDEARNDPGAQAQSGLSPYLHFGHLGAAEIALAAQEADSPAADRTAFLEELIVRRELAYNFVARTPRSESIDALPAWARETLAKHAEDPRQILPDRLLEEARTPDPVWNAAQRQLVREGRIHGYLRMLWGKLLLTWSADAREALRRMATLNNKYALDGRDAVSQANFLWCLGLHDKPFPERAIYGTVRSMTSASALRKLDLEGYLVRYGPRN